MKKIIYAVMLSIAFQIQAQEAPKYEVKHLESVNTKFADFGVSRYRDGVIFASSRKDQLASNKKWSKNHQRYLELYKGSEQSDGEISNIEYFSQEVNSKYHESNAVFSADMSTVYFSRNNYLDKKFKKNAKGWNLIQLYRAKVGAGGEWSEIEPLPFNSDDFNTGHPALSADEKTLYFTSDRPGGQGATDIWATDIHEDGSLGVPYNLGASVNTAGKEMFPYLSSDNTLYFSSDKYGGQGGLDVYSAKLTGDKSYAASENLGAPLNSVSDDFSFIIDEETKTGYFSSNRSGGKGDDDIYYFKEKEVEPEIIEVVEEGPCHQFANGAAKERKSGNYLPGTLVEIYELDESKIENKVEGIIVGSDGKFRMELDCNKSYRATGSKDGYTTASTTFVTGSDNNLELDLELLLQDQDIVSIGDRDLIRINPIYFDYDKSFIRPDAARELDKVVAVMQRYPNMIVQGGSHTDARGRDQYNWDLSNRRAAATREYIISRGISSSRISATGFGETQLVNRCSNNVKCSDAEHQQNRRTEFVVLRQ